MTSASSPIELFNLLASHVDSLLKVGRRQEENSAQAEAESVYRACIVLTISALDAFMHEKATAVFSEICSRGTSEPIRSYLGVNEQALQPPGMVGIIRYRLSFKTLVSPPIIDKAIEASGAESAVVWRSIGIDRGSRESRLRNMLDMFFDRRNAIAHEGDWDPIQFDLRHISDSHVRDCQECVRSVADGIDKHWKPQT